jgi:hypothetical protein
MPNERLVALKEKPKTPVAAQQPAGERGGVKITTGAVRETIAMGLGAVQRPTERGGVKITTGAVRETIAMAQQPAEQRAAASLGGTEQPTAKAKEGTLPKVEGTAFVADGQQDKATKVLDTKANSGATAASCRTIWTCC